MSNEKIGRMAVNVARELAKKDRELSDRNDLNSLLIRARCLNHIAAYSKHKDVVAYFPNKAESMAQYVAANRPGVQKALDEAKAELQPSLI